MLSISRPTAKKLPVDPKGLTAEINIWPIKDSTSNGVAIKVGGKTLKTQLCTDKQSIIQFLEKVL